MTLYSLINLKAHQYEDKVDKVALWYSVITVMTVMILGLIPVLIINGRKMERLQAIIENLNTRKS